MTIANVVFAVLGFSLSVLVKLVKGGVKPSDFSIKYWIDDNLYELILGVISIFVLLYFDQLIIESTLKVEVSSDVIFFDFFALCAGFSNHTLLHDVVKSFTKTK